MSFRHVMIVSLTLLTSLPLWAAEKKSSDKPSRGLASVYETLIRDSQKKLSPATDQKSLYLSVTAVQSQSRAPSSTAAPLLPARHAAIPWATEASPSGALFSVK